MTLNLQQGFVVGNHHLADGRIFTSILVTVDHDRPDVHLCILETHELEGKLDRFPVPLGLRLHRLVRLLRPDQLTIELG